MRAHLDWDGFALRRNASAGHGQFVRVCAQPRNPVQPVGSSGLKLPREAELAPGAAL